MLVQLYKAHSGVQEGHNLGHNLGTLYSRHTYAMLAAMQPSKDCRPAHAACAALHIRAAAHLSAMPCQQQGPQLHCRRQTSRAA